MSNEEKVTEPFALREFGIWLLIFAIVGAASVLTEVVGELSKWIFVPLALITILAFGLSLLKLPNAPIARQVAKQAGIGALLFGFIWVLQSPDTSETIEEPSEQVLEAEVPSSPAVIPVTIPIPEQSNEPPPPDDSVVTPATEEHSPDPAVPPDNRAEDTSRREETATPVEPAPERENECEAALRRALESDRDTERRTNAKAALSCPDQSFAHQAAEVLYAHGNGVLRRQAVIYLLAPQGKGRKFLITVPPSDTSSNSASVRADGLSLTIKSIDTETGDFKGTMSKNSGTRAVSGTVGLSGVSIDNAHGPFSFKAENDFHLRGTFREDRSSTVANIEIALN